MLTRESKADLGFSLIELLVVIIIIAIIAAIAIPSLLSSRRAASEASAIATMRTISSAQTAYFSVAGNQNFGDLSDLGSTDLLDGLLGAADTVSKNGYTFTISRPASAPYRLYCATGLADTFGQSGSRDFLVATAGVIYETPTDGSMSCSNGVPDTTGGIPLLSN